LLFVSGTARPRLSGASLAELKDRSAHGAQEPFDRVAADPAPVLDALLDGIPEMEPDKDA
jgi:hypothetical protein